jgi:hypothetical protein
MIILIIILFTLFIILRLIQSKIINEGFTDNRLVQSFKIKIGVWYDKDYDTMYKFVYKMSSFMPIQIIKYNNRYQPFYELKRRNVDLIFTNERDYYIYWINQLKKKKSALDSFRRTPQIQMITMAYHLYLLIAVDYNKIIRTSDINNSVIAISDKSNIGSEFEQELFNKYKTHMIYRKLDLNIDMENLCNTTDIMTFVNSHPNKLLLEYSNKKEIYLLDLNDIKPSNDYYDKYIFLNKKKLDLSYYPKIFQRYNSINRLGSLLIDTSPLMDAFSIKTLFMGLDILNNDYIYEFMKVYTDNIFDTIKHNIYFNNFTELEMSASRLTGDNPILNVHDGARRFYRKTGNYTFNPNSECALLRNQCTEDQLAKYGDYIKNQY